MTDEDIAGMYEKLADQMLDMANAMPLHEPEFAEVSKHFLLKENEGLDVMEVIDLANTLQLAKDFWFAKRRKSNG